MLCVRLIAVVFFGAAYAAAPSAEPATDPEIQRLLESTSVPQDVLQVLQLVHSLARTAVYQRDDFFSEEVMRSLFGREVRAWASRGKRSRSSACTALQVSSNRTAAADYHTCSAFLLKRERLTTTSGAGWMSISGGNAWARLRRRGQVPGAGMEARSTCGKRKGLRDQTRTPIRHYRGSLKQWVRADHHCSTGTTISSSSSTSAVSSDRTSSGGCLGQPNCSASD